jgi:4-aminobutyrate aminotransferase/(S)-3-amino-2-methylpropionate transaminase
VLDALDRAKLPERAERVGAAFREKLSHVVPTRGRGLMLGVQLESAAHALRVSRVLLERGWLVLTGGQKGDVLTLTPALTISETLLDAFVAELSAVLHRADVVR